MENDDMHLQDGQIASRAISILEGLQQRRESRRFFLGVGFHKPHLPEYCPQKYYDLYPRESVDLADNPEAPSNVPQIAVQTSELFAHWLPKGSGPCQQNF